MPELPEVETIARFLRSGGRGQLGLVGARISAVDLFWARTLATGQAPAELQPRLSGQSIVAIGRRGKFLRLDLDHDTLLFHLRMSGDLVVGPAGLPPGIHDRFSLDFSDGRRLTFVDPRKFGRVWLSDRPDEVLPSLGPEPLEDGFTPDWLFSSLNARDRHLKPLLLDQSFIAGLGNIYTDEALYRAQLHPLRPASGLTRAESDRLWLAIREVLAEGIDRQGSSIDWVYRGGDFQNYFSAYQRTGEACPRCGTPIERIVVGQRGTHFCPVCQPLLG
ncbi:MAG TPA: bifunctional DNA-formamidopyrimidine glycosylase/DNA-(apurinic or apyrimidinic site) lyase [Anaerolineaceae bacterium]|jgi:formamidopyrimidine-DNA glycosylase